MQTAEVSWSETVHHVAIAAMCPTLNLMAVAMQSGEVAVYRIDWQRLWLSRTLNKTRPLAMEWSPDGRHLALALDSNKVVVVDGTNGHVVDKRQADPVRSVRWRTVQRTTASTAPTSLVRKVMQDLPDHGLPEATIAPPAVLDSEEEPLVWLPAWLPSHTEPPVIETLGLLHQNGGVSVDILRGYTMCRALAPSLAVELEEDQDEPQVLHAMTKSGQVAVFTSHSSDLGIADVRFALLDSRLSSDTSKWLDITSLLLRIDGLNNLIQGVHTTGPVEQYNAVKAASSVVINPLESQFSQMAGEGASLHFIKAVTAGLLTMQLRALLTRSANTDLQRPAKAINTGFTTCLRIITTSMLALARLLIADGATLLGLARWGVRGGKAAATLVQEDVDRFLKAASEVAKQLERAADVIAEQRQMWHSFLSSFEQLIAGVTDKAEPLSSNLALDLIAFLQSDYGRTPLNAVLGVDGALTTAMRDMDAAVRALLGSVSTKSVSTWEWSATSAFACQPATLLAAREVTLEGAEPSLGLAMLQDPDLFFMIRFSRAAQGSDTQVLVASVRLPADRTLMQLDMFDDGQVMLLWHMDGESGTESLVQIMALTEDDFVPLKDDPIMRRPVLKENRGKDVVYEQRVALSWHIPSRIATVSASVARRLVVVTSADNGSVGWFDFDQYDDQEEAEEDTMEVEGEGEEE